MTGETFDGYQRNIRINHSALLEQGQARAGRLARVITDQSDELRLDADGNQVAAPAAESERQMKILINGKELEGAELQAAVCALEQSTKAATDKLDAEKTRADTAEGALKAETARAEKLDKERVDALAAATPEAIAKLAAAETAFRAQVAPVLGDKFDFAGKSRKDVKLAVIEKVDGEKLATDAADAFVDGYFNAAIKRAPKTDTSKTESEDYSKRDTSSAPEGDLARLDDAAWAKHIDSLVAKKGK